MILMNYMLELKDKKRLFELQRVIFEIHSSKTRLTSLSNFYLVRAWCKIMVETKKLMIRFFLSRPHSFQETLNSGACRKIIQQLDFHVPQHYTEIQSWS